MGFISRAADLRFTWGSNTFSAVRDVVHNVNLRFSPVPQTSTNDEAWIINANFNRLFIDGDPLPGRGG